ncbi:hypothetical protein PHYBLDRAFT_129333 [Phycomyces blakesleeanus NRRL 1555(-)]|uniref:Non-haem dioxygenase N-terminal domain-containing protein n=2 Tax=Phycomyces blakesleeanus TaxID=4837 RepID=A0A162V7V0_PHYB8|nr:hypothetical protein PHYBLDRAFT_129333 [Phycomyces blakesleeanus NRRL 1555(-)]OAD80693.1 hypothetical protein PHYBLDRAFT_129333 [Phycomyces blakesleeanus NRRL 1555(-)]|eukprot:XP_018298733.1 hypothetical protein PHYBLDRAFT_129333 [Phycomyces blakesleeanus NRRL 1555(-)]
MTIDLSDFNNRRHEIVQHLMKACTDHGFFYVINHGIKTEDINSMFSTSETFFGLPDNIKEKYPLDTYQNTGWEKLTEMDSCGTEIPKESMQLTFHDIPDHWPANEDIPGFQNATNDFMHQCNTVSYQLLSCLATGLGFPEDFFARCHDITQPDNLNTLKCLYYPSSTSPSYSQSGHNNSWSGKNIDINTLTLFFQPPGQNQFEVTAPGLAPGSTSTPNLTGRTRLSTEPGNPRAPRNNNHRPQQDQIVCSIGDMIARWSDDRFKSSLYRISVPRSDELLGSRQCIQYCNKANKSTIIQGQSKYKEPITAGELIMMAMEREYKAAMQSIKANRAAIESSGMLKRSPSCDKGSFLMNIMA